MPVGLIGGFKQGPSGCYVERDEGQGRDQGQTIDRGDKKRLKVSELNPTACAGVCEWPWS